MAALTNTIDLQPSTETDTPTASVVGQIRLLGIATLAVLLLGVLTVATGAAEPPLETRVASATEIQTLSSSAATLAEAPGYRYEVEININGTAIDMDGVFAGTAGEFHLELPGIGPVTYAFDDTAIYLPVRGTVGWIAFTAPGLDDPTAAAAVAGEDPLATLAAITNTEVLHAGRHTINGIATTRYRAEISYQALLEASPINPVQLNDPEVQALLADADPVEFDAWIDDVGLLRKLRTEANISGLTATTTVHTTPLDTAPALAVPPAPILETRSFDTLDALIEATTRHFATL